MLKLDGLSPPAVKLKLVDVGSGLGFVTFLTMIVPRLSVFVNVHVTVSPGLRSMFETGLPSSHVELVRFQSEGTVSATLYPFVGLRLEQVVESPFFMLKLVGLSPPQAVN